ncbi:MAG: methyl-accepting chemotaxis protein [Zoogloea sp.]|nr:methyl-accepting chemotaxis protein [Zoogloea sp.]
MSSSATQNDRILDIASAMDQMTASVGEISSHMTESTQAVRSTEGTAHDAITDMEQAVAASDSAASVATASQARIVDMNQSIGRITELTNIIRDIADQTNLLALNAAIEAARAGEQGRGFAVVADEVRKLAEKTASSTADISRVVDEIIQKSRNAVDTMDSVSAQVRKTASGIGLSGERLREIWTLSHTATEHTQSIENMLHQQTDMTTQVTDNINQISAVIEATSGNVNTVGQASAQLHNTASELRELIKHLEKALV